jgi:hypothetical protein
VSRQLQAAVKATIHESRFKQVESARKYSRSPSMLQHRLVTREKSGRAPARLPSPGPTPVCQPLARSAILCQPRSPRSSAAPSACCLARRLQRIVSQLRTRCCAVRATRQREEYLIVCYWASGIGAACRPPASCPSIPAACRSGRNKSAGPYVQHDRTITWSSLPLPGCA